MTPRKITLSVNGKTRSANAEPRLTLLDFLREHLSLTGTHMGCEHGVCGACTVNYDGVPVRACLIYAVQADGHEVETVEGLCKPDGTPGPVQEAFQDAHGLQCGYCTPGMLVSATALLRTTPDPSDEEIREGLGGNLCRCTGYTQIIDAVRLAAKTLKGAGG
jgi:carbon-monoxide dehydrogenase small subunit